MGMTRCEMIMKPLSMLIMLVAIESVTPSVTHAQLAKEINEETQLWVSINSTARITHRWGLVTDFHIRRNNFIEDPSFYFLRLGSNFWVTEKFTLTAGYAHMWRGPVKRGLEYTVAMRTVFMNNFNTHPKLEA